MANKVKSIEAEISQLSREEVRQLALWLTEYDFKLWDRQIEEDSQAGRLNSLFEEAETGRKQGTLRDWPPVGK
jgi:hypothetical protein